MSQLRPRKRKEHHKIDKETFRERFLRQFCDKNFDPYQSVLNELCEVAWKNYSESRKAPFTTPAGDSFHDPTYELSEDWRETLRAIKQAEKDRAASPVNVLLIMASDRNEGTCPGEYSKTSRLCEIAKKNLEQEGITVELLDLSEITAEYGKMIYPCKGCVSTAMPLCHWPCSCYPNHALGQTHDWMNDIYPLWVKAHGVMIITPVYWHQAPSCLKLMMDRLVCADGGNPDPTTTHGKKAEEAKQLELEGWNYPRHLKGRYFSLVVHGDTVGALELKTALSEWLQNMELIPAPREAVIARYIGYYEPYATSHEALDKDEAMQKEVENAAKMLAWVTKEGKAGNLQVLERDLKDPRPK